MTWIDRQRADELVQSLRERTGRPPKKEETSAKDSELPKGEVVRSSIEDVELTATEESSKSFWPSDVPTVGELQDGTNLPTGTNYTWQSWKSERWFDPSAVVENPTFGQTLKRLSERMKSLQLQGKRFPVSLEQSQIPKLGGRVGALASFRSCSVCNGLSLEPVHLRPHVAVVPVFAFPDATGKPISNSAGDPFPFRLGFSRSHFVKRASAEDLQLFSDAAKVLSVLPAFVNEVLWKRWRQGFPLPEDGFDEGVWIDAVFETSWQQLPFSSLRASRKAFSADGNTSVVLKGEGLFPRIPPDLWSMVPNVQGYPQRIRSELPDLLESSLQLIETILAIPEPAVEEERKTTGRTAEVPIVSISTICDTLCRQKNSRSTLKKILEQSKRGLSPSQIARENSGKGFSLSNISEKLTEVRTRFPGFLPE